MKSPYFGRRLAPLFFLLCALWVVAAPALAEPLTVKDVAKEMICPCPDCGKQALDQCPNCAIGQQLRDKIGVMLRQGKSKNQILTQFAATYGDDILGDPPARGIAKSAPVMPFLAAFLGLIPIAFIIRSRRNKPRSTVATTNRGSVPAAPVASRVAADDPLLRQALSEFDY